MFHLYALPLSLVCRLMALGILLWVSGDLAMRKKPWEWFVFNLVMLCVALGGIAFKTLVGRMPTRQIEWIPFISFVRAREQREYYRSMLMNVFLFFPFGLTFPHVIGVRNRCKSPYKKTVLAGLGLSVMIEVLQFLFCLGCSEADDIIMNTLGAALGGSAYWIAAWIKQKLQKRKEQL